MPQNCFSKHCFKEGNLRNKCCSYLSSLAKLGVIGEVKEEFPQHLGRLLAHEERGLTFPLRKPVEIPAQGGSLGARAGKQGLWTMKDSDCRKLLMNVSEG